MKNLQEIKERIQFESSNSANNERLKSYITDPEDCFGRKYNDEYSECQSCRVLANLDGRKEPINVFCKEIMIGNKEEGEVKEIMEEKQMTTEVTPEVSTEKKEKVKKEPKPKEPMAEWKLKVKELFDGGATKEEVVAAITATYSDVAPGKIAVIYNCHVQTKKRQK